MLHHLGAHVPSTAPTLPAPPKGLALVVVAAGLTMSATLAQAVANRFDVDAEGWSVTDARSGIGNGSATWLAPGVIQTNDQFDWTAFSAPAAYLGDQRAMFGGTLSFELQAARQDPGAANYFTVALRSGADLLVWFGGAPGLTELTPFSVELAPGPGWALNPSALGQPGSGTLPDAAAFRAFLQQVDALYIDADYRGGSDNVMLDNVSLLPVPEPGLLPMWLAGCIALAAWMRRGRVRPAG